MAVYGYETKSRALAIAKDTGYRTMTTVVPGQPISVSQARHTITVTGRQTTTSKLNTGFHNARRLLAAHKAGKVKLPAHAVRNLELGDFGGNFESIKHEYKYLGRYYRGRAQSGYTTYDYSGPFSPCGASEIHPLHSTWPVVTPPSDEYLFGLGGTAVSRCLPTAPAADLATFLGELREGLPKMLGQNLLSIKQFRGLGKGSGGEYLNYQFGIKPMLADLRKLNDAVVQSDKVITQFLRDSDRMIRRRYNFPTTVVEEAPRVVSTNAQMFPTLPTAMYAGFNGYTGTLTVTRKVTIETWFSGAFTYHVDFDADKLSRLHRKAQEVRRIYGVRLTPDVAWNLAPWSWLADWFANFGDVLTNASQLAADGLVMRYGYLMYKETIEDTYTHSGVALKGDPTGPVSQVFRTVYKRRVKAHPFGFGLKDESLSPRQLAILAALGLSRGSAR